MKLRNIQAWSIAALAICASQFLQTSASAADVRKTNRADISNFDVYGVRLGMSETEGYSALREKFGDAVTRDNSSDSSVVLCAAQPEFRVCADVRKSQVPGWRAQVVSVNVDYTAPVNNDAFVKRLISKYGQPTFGYTVGYRVMWCAQDTRGAWDSEKPYLEYSPYNGGPAHLTLSNKHGVERHLKRLEDQSRPVPKL